MGYPTHAAMGLRRGWGNQVRAGLTAQNAGPSTRPGMPGLAQDDIRYSLLRMTNAGNREQGIGSREARNSDQ